jgi:serine/threonine protein kinase, bacterial
MALASGANFAGYVVARRLGSGATGAVYLVQDPRSARWVTLKVLSLAMSMDSDFRQRFLTETATTANLYHPHIVEVYDRGEFEGQLWIAMEYVEGRNAAQLMADRFPAVSPAGEVLAIVTAVADALDHAHQRGLLHRDVKPANILLTRRGEGEQRILLADFGIARQLGEAPGGTGTNVPVGTVGYAAPEQLMGADIDGRADQYALAATAFHLLTGAPPVVHSNPVAALSQLLNGAPPRLSEQRPELARLDGVFSRALAKRPADRFESCRAFAGAANEQAGVSIGDRSPEAVLVADYPAYAWPDVDEIPGTESARETVSDARPGRPGTRLHSAAAALARRLDNFSTGRTVPAALAGQARAVSPKRRRPRKILLGAAAVVLLVGLLGAGFVIGRKTDKTATQAVPATTSASAAAGAPTASTAVAAPIPLDGTYRLEVQRTKQTFDYTPDPQPPDVNTWWAFRSSCTPSSCTAAGMLLDDNDHARAKSPGGEPLVLDFLDGRWLSRPEKAPFPCIGPNGAGGMDATTLVLSLRPRPQGDFVGEETVAVQTNACGQRSAVMRIPAVLSRSGDASPAVAVPDPATLTDTPTPPTTSGPHR